MTFSDILLWMAGVSWLITALTAISRARAGDLSLLKYFGFVLVVGAVPVLVFPAAIGWILGLLWLFTLVIPGILTRYIQRYVLKRRFVVALRLIGVLPVLHPIGPYAMAARVLRYQCYKELGRTAEAKAIEASFDRLPAPQRRQVMLYVLASDQRWQEILEQYRGRPAIEAGIYRLRAFGETGDLRAMLEDFRALSGYLEAQRLQFQQVLAVVLAFGGRPDRVRALLTEAAPAIRTYWEATAIWAAGDQDRARAMLEEIRDPSQPCLQAAIEWRMAHPPVQVHGLEQGLVEQFDQISAMADRTIVLRVGRPWTTWAILAVCVVMFGFTASAEHLGEALWLAGAFDPSLGWVGNWWRFVASGFLHVNLIHLTMNSLGLLLFAPGLERTFGWWRFLTLYLVAGIGGMALVQILTDRSSDQHSIVVGASASIMGLIGAELVRVIRGRLPGEAWWRHPQVRRMGVLLVVQVLFDLSHPDVSQAGHIGGFLMGVGMGWMLGNNKSVVKAR